MQRPNKYARSGGRNKRKKPVKYDSDVQEVNRMESHANSTTKNKKGGNKSKGVRVILILKHSLRMAALMESTT